MSTASENRRLSVTEIAQWCGVGRSTVGYWIRSGKLQADRVGRDYAVPTQDLFHFLNATGRAVPDWLREVVHCRSSFQPFRFCWEARKEEDGAAGCTECMVYRKRLRACFTGRCHIALPGREIHCSRCRYYLEHVAPRIDFIHQIAQPAAVYEDLYIWGANSRFSERTGIVPEDLPGFDMERLIHPESLGTVITNIKARALGDENIPSRYPIRVKGVQGDQALVEICIVPLEEPEGTFLVLFHEMKEGTPEGKGEHHRTAAESALRTA